MSAALFRHLEVFRTVIDAGTATMAAERLGMSQPAVSQHLAQLEQKLGLVLFVREHGRLVPTEAGLELYDELAFAFDGLDRIMNFARDVRTRNRGVLRIAAPHSFCHVVVPRALVAFSRAHPEIRYEIEMGAYGEIVAMVAGRRVDLGIAREPIVHPGIAREPVAACGTVCVVWRGHALAAAERLTIADVAEEPLIMIGRHRPWRSEIDVLFRRANLAPRIRLETHSVGSACSFAAARIGVALVPEILARQYLGRGLHAVPIELPIRHEFALAFPATLHNRELATDFARVLSEAMSGFSVRTPALPRAAH